MSATRKPYPSDVSDDEWQFVLPYLTLMRLDGPHATMTYATSSTPCAGWRVRGPEGDCCRMIPRRGRRSTSRCNAGCAQVSLRRLPTTCACSCPPRRARRRADRRHLRLAHITIDGGEWRAGYDGYKRKRGSKVGCPLGSIAVDTLGHLLALYITPANIQDRAAVAALAARVQEETGDHVTLAYVDQGYTGEQTAQAATDQGIALEVVKLPDAKHGFVLLPRRWVAERDFAWTSRFRRPARDYERSPETLAGLHLVAFVILMLQRLSAANSS